MTNPSIASAHSPLVTIYITSHNYGLFIRQSIESVLNQVMNDFELIIIDDGSSDNSRDIIDEYADHPKVISIYQQNKGLSITNNIAIRAARGKYIMRLDADDWLDAHALEVMTATLERETDVGLVFPDYYLTDDNGQVIEQVRRHDFDDVTLPDQPAHGACTMIRLQCLHDLDGYNESYNCQDGYDLWIRFIEHFKVKNINLPLFYYRQHGSSLTRNEARIFETRRRIIERQVNLKDAPVKALGILPVRGSSPHTASLALMPLAGRPLINWTIDAALDSRHISDLVVSTPDEDILNHIEKVYGDGVIRQKRDIKLARHNVPIEDTLVNVLNQYANQSSSPTPEILVCLAIDAPFRNGHHIDMAVEVMQLFDTDSVIGVKPETNLFYHHNGKGMVPVRKVSPLRLEREEIYREVVGQRVIRTDFFRENMKTTGGRIGHTIFDQRAAFCIVSDFDWKIAEFVANDILMEQQID